MGPDDVAAHRDRSVDVRGPVPDSSDGDAGRGATDRLSRWRHLSVRAAWRTVPDPCSAHDGAAGMGRTLLAGGAIVGAASVAAEDSASSVKRLFRPSRALHALIETSRSRGRTRPRARCRARCADSS